ncbi:hypothetical protein Nepgr_030577 [Nepenthes gracilis]|uniref:Myb-like domain-containing protein n=1 Tax=Nepenthes gracilis TaxID=150966 RepID=A0AAD3TGE0_NEPGR|nr:hypothetical protein Nepgr_030577 [Nepenthes gracilis]
MEMEDQYHRYAIGDDARHFISAVAAARTNPSSQFPSLQQQLPDFFSTHRGLTLPPLPYHQHHQPYEMLVMGRTLTDMVPSGGGGGGGGGGGPCVPLHEFHSESTTTTTTTATNTTVTATNSGGGNASFSVFDAEDGGTAGGFCLDGGTARWPRQETLTLLEIRSWLDHKFKESNQKGPLWDEVSRIMCKEHGYQRSGKKCREKFENLYKYYKKTKDGKAGRQDGRNYRFFRQLEALYGETSNAGCATDTHVAGTNTNSSLQFQHNSTAAATCILPDQEAAAFHRPVGLSADSISSLSESSDFDSPSADGDGEAKEIGGSIDNGEFGRKKEKKKTKRGNRSWKAKIKEFIDTQVKKVMEKQEAWLEKMMRTLEHKEQERLQREEEWRQQVAKRVAREREFWSNERAWIEARDAALMDALRKLAGSSVNAAASSEHNQSGSNDQRLDEIAYGWPESELTGLINLRTSMDSRFRQCGSCLEDQSLWKEIASKMGCVGFDGSPLALKEKWETINEDLMKKNNKKRKEN